MKHFKTIEDYCHAIGIPRPKYPDFDIRDFKDNMSTVVSSMPPFRHEFYAIALKIEGSGIARTGHHQDFPEGSTVFFNSPFQLISWDIAPNWEGFYIMFSQDFIAKSVYLQDILKHFPFLKIEKSIPFTIDQQDILEIVSIYTSILKEYNSNNADKFLIIESFVLLLLNFVKRYFNKTMDLNVAKQEIRKTDLKLLARFQTLIETHFYPDSNIAIDSKVHLTSFYAEKLHIHPNHLNAVVKQITGQTAKQHVQKHVLNLAKSRLLQTDNSIKEIAYSLHFDSPNNFTNFFKKQEKVSPNTYRKEAIL